MLAAGMKKPIVGVNHLEGHIAANWLEPICGISNFQFPISKQFSIFKSQISKQNSNSKFKMRNLFPAICLIVSGGHTQLVLIKEAGKYKVIGQTRDDAAGEAFDKVAKLLGLGYPGGPRIASIAKNGAPDAFKLPRPMIDSPDLDFSFSGLKTAVLYLVRSLDSRLRGNDKLVGDLCASFQQAVVDVLVDKTISAAKKYKARTIMLSGGVAANQELRKQMRKAVIKNLPNTKYLIPNTKYCVDNAVMIGLAGYWKFIRNGGDKLEKLVAKANSNL
jgi:N6-L-threonylcarbamoyladenine synthase